MGQKSFWSRKCFFHPLLLSFARNVKETRRKKHLVCIIFNIQQNLKFLLLSLCVYLQELSFLVFKSLAGIQLSQCFPVRNSVFFLTKTKAWLSCGQENSNFTVFCHFVFWNNFPNLKSQAKKNQMILHKESGFIAEGAVLLNKSTCSESYQRSVPLISKQIDSALSRFAVSQR